MSRPAAIALLLLGPVEKCGLTRQSHKTCRERCCDSATAPFGWDQSATRQCENRGAPRDRCGARPRKVRSHPSPLACRVLQRASPYASKAIKPNRGSRKEVRLFCLGRASRQQLAGVPEYRIAVGALVDREVALEHRARRSKGLDASLNVGAPCIRQSLGRARFSWLVEADPANAHAEPPELHMHVLAGRQPLNRGRPARKHLFALTRIGADPDWPADVVEDDRRVRECAREAGKLVNLRVEKPSVE